MPPRFLGPPIPAPIPPSNLPPVTPPAQPPGARPAVPPGLVGRGQMPPGFGNRPPGALPGGPLPPAPQPPGGGFVPPSAGRPIGAQPGAAPPAAGQPPAGGRMPVVQAGWRTTPPAELPGGFGVWPGLTVKPDRVPGVVQPRGEQPKPTQNYPGLIRKGTRMG